MVMDYNHGTLSPASLTQSRQNLYYYIVLDACLSYLIYKESHSEGHGEIRRNHGRGLKRLEKHKILHSSHTIFAYIWYIRIASGHSQNVSKCQHQTLASAARSSHSPKCKNNFSPASTTLAISKTWPSSMALAKRNRPRQQGQA